MIKQRKAYINEVVHYGTVACHKGARGAFYPELFSCPLPQFFPKIISKVFKLAQI